LVCIVFSVDCGFRIIGCLHGQEAICDHAKGRIQFPLS
jgi:hypothetical protein